MALLTEITVLAQVYGDTAKANRLSELNIPKHVLDSFTLVASGRIAVATGASDVPACMQSVTDGKLVMLKSEGEFTVKFNGTGNPEITLTPQTNSLDNTVTPAFLLMLSSGITSMHFGNPGADDIEIDIAVIE